MTAMFRDMNQNLLIWSKETSFKTNNYSPLDTLYKQSIEIHLWHLEFGLVVCLIEKSAIIPKEENKHQPVSFSPNIKV